MATDIYNKQIEAFYKDVGEGDITVINGPTDSTLNKGSVVGYTPKRWSLVNVYDLFWRAGISLYRVLRSLDFEKLVKHTPSLFFNESLGLSSNKVSLTTSYDFIYDIAIVAQTSPAKKYTAIKIPPSELIETISSVGLRRSPTATNPKFSIHQESSLTKIIVYPEATTFNSITISGFLTVSRLVASTNGSDTWNKNLSDLLIAGAVALAKSNSGDADIASMYLQQLQSSYQLVARKSTKQNNSFLEEEK